MTLLEVFTDPNVLSSQMWFRPKTWKGCRQAFVVRENRICMVPSIRGALPVPLYVTDILEDWVIVSPDVVNTEA